MAGFIWRTLVLCASAVILLIPRPRMGESVVFASWRGYMKAYAVVVTMTHDFAPRQRYGRTQAVQG